MPYDLIPTHFDGVDLTAAPFNAGGSVVFSPTQGPMQSEQMESIQATVIGKGQRQTRTQPKGTTWDLIVIISDLTEAGFVSLKKIFDPDKGLCYLRADDGGTPTNWRVPAQVIEVERTFAAQFIVHLAIPNPVWEENTQTTTTGNFANMGASSPYTQAVTPNGIRRTFPSIELKADSVKTLDPEQDFTFFFTPYIVNRSPRALTNWPVMLKQYDSALLIKDTSVSNQINSGAGITSGASTIPYDTPVGGGLPAAPGFAYIVDATNGDEQIYYRVKTGTELQSCTRGVGGTTAVAHADNRVIAKSSVLANGDDVRVYVNGREVERWLGAFNTSATKIWINATMPPRVKLTLGAPISSGNPASGVTSEIAFKEGVGALPESGHIAHLVSQNELFYYRERDVAQGKVRNISRTAWWTNWDITPFSSPCYANAQLVVICMGKLTPGFAPDSIERRPACDLKQSDNSAFYYGDTTQDPNTVFYDPARPNRSAMFRPEATVPATDRNAAQPLRLDTSTTKAEWKDSLPTQGKPQVDRLVLNVPVGIEAGVNSFVDVQRRKTLRMRVLGRDAAGFETELLDQYDFAEALSAAATFQPVDTMYDLILNACRAQVTGQSRGEVEDTMSAAGNRLASKLVLDQDSFIEALHLKLRKSGAGDNFNFKLWVTKDTNTPSTTVIVGRFFRWSGDGTTNGTFPSSALTTAVAEYQFLPSSADGKMFLPAGTYYIYINMNSVTSGGLMVSEAENPVTKHNETNLNGTARGGSVWFRLIHPNGFGGPIQSDADDINEDRAGNFDKVALALNDASADPYTVAVINPDPSNTACYHAIGVFKNDDTGDTLTFDAFLNTGGIEQTTLTIDCATREAKLVDGDNWDFPWNALVTPSNRADYFYIRPQASTLRYTEARMTNTDITVKHRGRR